MRWFVVTAAAYLGGCGSLAAEDYPGEPLVQLRGMAQGPPRSTEAATFDGAVRWQRLAQNAATLMRVPLEPSFPTFWIDVVAWPPDDVFVQLGDEPAFAEGYLHIVRADLEDQAAYDDILATELSHALIYVREAIAADSMTARYLGGALAPGFHVASRRGTTALDPAQQLLVEQCVALAGDASNARAICTLQHLYQLAPAPLDLDTLLTFVPM